MTGCPFTCLISAITRRPCRLRRGSLELDPDRLPGKVLAPHVRHLDGEHLVAGLDIHRADHQRVAQPAAQRLADAELDGGGRDRVVRVEGQVEQAAAELGLVHPLPGGGEQHLDDLAAKLRVLVRVGRDRARGVDAERKPESRRHAHLTRPVPLLFWASATVTAGVMPTVWTCAAGAAAPVLPETGTLTDPETVTSLISRLSSRCSTTPLATAKASLRQPPRAASRAAWAPGFASSVAPSTAPCNGGESSVSSWTKMSLRGRAWGAGVPID